MLRDEQSNWCVGALFYVNTINTRISTQGAYFKFIRGHRVLIRGKRFIDTGEGGRLFDFFQIVVRYDRFSFKYIYISLL